MESVFFFIVKITPKLELKNNSKGKKDLKKRSTSKQIYNNEQKKNHPFQQTNYSNKKQINHDAQLNAERSHITQTHINTLISICVEMWRWEAEWIAYNIFIVRKCEWFFLFHLTNDAAVISLLMYSPNDTFGSWLRHNIATNTFRLQFTFLYFVNELYVQQTK